MAMSVNHVKSVWIIFLWHKNKGTEGRLYNSNYKHLKIMLSSTNSYYIYT